jgi:hypothetical protein
MSDTEKRAHPRSEYFLIKSEGQAVPIYAFRDEKDLAAIPALVVDLSEGGVQVLTADTAEVDCDEYELEIVPEEATSPRNRIKMVKVWQRKDGLNIRSGLAFRDGEHMQSQIAELLSNASHRLLRCVLHPSDQS